MRRLLSSLLLLPLLCTRLTADWQPPVDASDLFLGTVVSVQSGPTGMSMPPLLTWRFTVKVEEVFRGKLQAGQTVALHYSYRGEAEPKFESGEQRVFAVQEMREARSIQELPLAKSVSLEALRGPDFPGWTRDATGKWISPWGDGRSPAALPAQLEWSVVPVPPEKVIEWTNPDGDGWYRLTLRNTGDAPMSLAALPSSPEGEILWDHAVLMSIQGEIYRLPSEHLPPETMVPTVLAAGAEISGIVQPTGIHGPKWPRGGSRVKLGFILGDQIRTQSFYYMSRHHDAFRQH